MNYYTKESKKLESACADGQVKWSSPSNIALVKYWGKHGRQLPSNPSISLTLDKSRSTTSISWKFKELSSKDVSVDFYFENEKKESFADKIIKFFNSIVEDFPFLTQLEFEIHSENSFPHSAGIASSASSMSALALCLCEIEAILFNKEIGSEAFMKKASYYARLGSGSACRSLYSNVVTWGNSTDSNVHSDDEFAAPLVEFNPVFKTFRDSILIVDAGEKSVSSRAGHALMNTHPFASIRFSNAKKNMGLIISAMQEGDLKVFGEIVETEALELHGLMMNSSPSFILMKPATLEIINKVREFRTRTDLPLYFTLDAGPNVHLLYPDLIVDEVQSFIKSELLTYTANNKSIEDCVGLGPKKEI
jgi:diphosphomevalonate decarboxylase